MWLPVFIANEQITHLHISQPEGIINGIFATAVCATNMWLFAICCKMFWTWLEHGGLFMPATSLLMQLLSKLWANGSQFEPSTLFDASRLLLKNCTSRPLTFVKGHHWEEVTPVAHWPARYEHAAVVRKLNFE